MEPEEEERRSGGGGGPLSPGLPAGAQALPFGSLPWLAALYRILVPLLLGTALIGAAIRALLPDLTTWPFEHFHVNAAAREDYLYRHARIPIDLDWASNPRPYVYAPPLPRFEGMRIRVPVTGLDTIRVLPDEVELEPPPVEREQPEFIVEEEPRERQERARRRTQPRPGGGGPPVVPGAPPRNVQSGQDQLGSSGSISTRTMPMYGPSREYPNDEGPELIGTRTIQNGGPGSSSSRMFQTPQDPEGLFGGFPPPTRTITALRLLPTIEFLEAGTCQEYDLQAQMDYQDWFSVTTWPETSFRIKTPDRGVVQHRRADNVFCVPAETPMALNGAENVIEGSFRVGSGANWTAQAVIIVVVPRDEAEAKKLLERRPRDGFKPWHYRYMRTRSAPGQARDDDAPRRPTRR